MLYYSKIYLNNANISSNEWQKLINDISKYNGYFKKWQLIIEIDNNKINYCVRTNFQIPQSFCNNSSFQFKKSKAIIPPENYITLPIILPLNSNIIDCINYFNIKKLGHIKYITIKFKRIKEDKVLSKIHIYYEYNNKIIKTRLLIGIPNELLAIDFKKNNTYIYEKVPKYLDISKIYHLLKTDQLNTPIEVDTFPYLDGNFYLDYSKIDFNRHSLILGSSGFGKSKYISSLIKTIHDLYPNNYKVVMIDPHASIAKDIGALGNTIDFKSIEDSINLFHTNKEDIISATELTLDLFKNLISDQYNSKVERVLRHSIYLLIANDAFNFISLKKLLTDSVYRTNLINNVDNTIPSSVTHFFLNDFNELKTRSYTEAISPIISFIDEMAMIPVFNSENIINTLEDSLKNNFLTLFSLDKTILGDKVTKTISGFIMSLLFLLIEKKVIKEHIIFIVDEVPTIENNILSNFLSESRKYNLSLILAAQYFNQISPSLKDSIFANVINYYIFRLSRTDASLIASHLEMKIPNISNLTIEEQLYEKINILSNLKCRECIFRISSNNITLPSFKAKTLDFVPLPIKEKKSIAIVNNSSNEPKGETKIDFKITNPNLKEILSRTSSSRMVVK